MISVCVKIYCVSEMKVVVFLALLHTYACKGPSRPRSVNVALETIVEFDNNDNSADIQIIDQMRNFLDRVKIVIDKNKGYRRSRSDPNTDLTSRRLKLTDFIKHILAILSSYDDRDLEDVVVVVNDEIGNYHYKGCKFHELFENRNVRRAMANNLKKIKNTPVKEVKKQIKTMLRTFENNSFGMMHKMVVNYVNSLYGHNAEDKFKAVLNKLSKYRRRSERGDLELSKIIRDALRSIVFDHYSRLNSKTRRDLKLKLDSFWAGISNPNRELHHVWKFNPLDSKVKLNEELDEGSRSVEMELQKTTRQRKRYIKIESEKEKQTTKRHFTFITLYPEEMTVSRDSHKTKSTKTPKHLWDHERTKRLKVKSKKPRAVRKIISEHAAEINVEKDTISRVFGAFDELLHPPPIQVSESPVEPTSKTHKRRKQRPDKRDSKLKVHKKSKKRKHKKISREIKRRSRDSYEGLSILSVESNEVTESFRKSNFNDTLLSNDTDSIIDEIPPTPIPVSVIRRISDLEKELRDVKAQINATNKDDSVDDESPPVYESLDFWEGTTKSEASTSTPTLTAKEETTTRTTTTTTTTTPKPTTTTVATTKKLTIDKVNNTVGPVYRFRSKKINDSEVLKKVRKRPEKKVTEKHVTEKKAVEKKHIEKKEIKSNVTELDQLGPTKYNSSEIDYFSDKMPTKMNLTGIEDIERYLNDTTAVGGDKIQLNVRKQMLDNLKGLLSENPGLPEDSNYTALLPSTPIMSDSPDPMNFLDVVDEDLK